MNEKQTIPGEKSMKGWGSRSYTGGFIVKPWVITDKPWPNEARHAVAQIIKGGSNDG